jgi:hypothetical protein
VFVEDWCYVKKGWGATQGPGKVGG